MAGGIATLELKNSTREGVSRRGEGPGRVSAANWGFFLGGGLNIFFRGRNVHQGNLWDFHCAIALDGVWD